MSKTTPGPWRAGKIPASPFADPPEVMVIQGACGEWVCKMLHPSDDPKAAANAALIAKAYLLPQVERVLEDCCALAAAWAGYYSSTETYGMGGKVHPMHQEIIDAARALLAALKEAP